MNDTTRSDTTQSLPKKPDLSGRVIRGEITDLRSGTRRQANSLKPNVDGCSSMEEVVRQSRSFGTDARKRESSRPNCHARAQCLQGVPPPKMKSCQQGGRRIPPESGGREARTSASRPNPRRGSRFSGSNDSSTMSSTATVSKERGAGGAGGASEQCGPEHLGAIGNLGPSESGIRTVPSPGDCIAAWSQPWGRWPHRAQAESVAKKHAIPTNTAKAVRGVDNRRCAG